MRAAWRACRCQAAPALRLGPGDASVARLQVEVQASPAVGPPSLRTG